LLRGSLTSLVDPRDERLIHRLEAFSDIVIGFSMALLAINLQPNVAGIDRLLPALVAFLVSFGFVALLWWLHNRLFAYYFTATPVTIVLNFAALAGVALFIFATTAVAQKFMVPHADVRVIAPFLSLWMGLYGATLSLLAVLYAAGLRSRWSELTYDVRRWGVARALNSGVGGVALLLIAFFIGPFDDQSYKIVVPLALASVIAEKLLTPRIVGKAPAL